jgi:pSer/pThr/pTyr-binding forkhead associated (FHA) protein
MKKPVDDFEEATTTESQVGVLFKRRKAQPPALEQVDGPGSPRKILLEAEKVVVGRSGDADIQVDSAKVSRSHALLRRQGNEVSCVDLESRNGVYLNGVKIHSATLRQGDTLQLGDAVFLFHEGT